MRSNYTEFSKIFRNTTDWNNDLVHRKNQKYGIWQDYLMSKSHWEHRQERLKQKKRNRLFIGIVFPIYATAITLVVIFTDTPHKGH